MEINSRINNQRNIHFKQISPEHLFINSPKYGRNMNWAKLAIDTVEQATSKIKKQEPFENVIGFIAQKYNGFFSNAKNLSGKTIEEQDRNFFGKLRNDCVVTTYISENNRYSPYVPRVLSFINKRGEEAIAYVENIMHCSNVYKPSVKDSFFTKKPLSTIIVANDKLSEEELNSVGSHLIKLESPRHESIKPTFKKINALYSSFIQQENASTTNQIQPLTQTIAQIHWYLSQVTPYYRGSAGIADLFCKSLFESKSIQVSPYRKGVDPNMEAFVMTLKDYTQKYKTFFQNPLTPFNSAK